MQDGGVDERKGMTAYTTTTTTTSTTATTNLSNLRRVSDEVIWIREGTSAEHPAYMLKDCRSSLNNINDDTVWVEWLANGQKTCIYKHQIIVKDGSRSQQQQSLTRTRQKKQQSRSNNTQTQLVVHDPEKKKKSWPLSGIKEPGNNDVLSGRGGLANHHPGNIKNRRIIDNYKLVAGSCLSHSDHAMAILKDWRALDPPGRFLRFNEETRLWDDIGDKEAVKKVVSRLREKRSSKLGLGNNEDNSIISSSDEEDAAQILVAISNEIAHKKETKSMPEEMISNKQDDAKAMISNKQDADAKATAAKKNKKVTREKKTPAKILDNNNKQDANEMSLELVVTTKGTTTKKVKRAAQGKTIVAGASNPYEKQYNKKTNNKKTKKRASSDLAPPPSKEIKRSRNQKRGKYSSFKQRLVDLAVYKEKHGHLDVKNEEDKALYMFCNNQKYARKHNNISEDRIEKLDALGFNWESGLKAPYVTKTFDEKLNDLKEYKAEHGRHAEVDRNTDKKLHAFCAAARHAHKYPGKFGTIKLTAARIAALSNIGFDWKTKLEDDGASSLDGAERREYWCLVCSNTAQANFWGKDGET